MIFKKIKGVLDTSLWGSVEVGLRATWRPLRQEAPWEGSRDEVGRPWGPGVRGELGRWVSSRMRAPHTRLSPGSQRGKLCSHARCLSGKAGHPGEKRKGSGSPREARLFPHPVSSRRGSTHARPCGSSVAGPVTPGGSSARTCRRAGPPAAPTAL